MPVFLQGRDPRRAGAVFSGHPARLLLKGVRCRSAGWTSCRWRCFHWPCWRWRRFVSSVMGLADAACPGLVRKELIELRDPRLFGIVIVAPFVQLTLLGYAATTDARRAARRSSTQDRSVEEPRAHQPLRGVAELRDRRLGVVADRSSAISSSGRAWMALDIRPAGERSRTGRPVQCQWSPTAATRTPRNAALGYRIARHGHNRELGGRAGAPASSRSPSAQVRVVQPALETGWPLVIRGLWRCCSQWWTTDVVDGDRCAKELRHAERASTSARWRAGNGVSARCCHALIG